MADDRLDSWKEIAGYLKRDVTTVRRWEKREGLPVHRHLHERRDSVSAYRTEIDAWWESRRNHLAENGGGDGMNAGTGNGESDLLVAPTAPSMPPPRRLRRAWILAATFVVATLILVAFLTARGQFAAVEHQPEVRFSIAPPADTTFGAMSLSPDGRQLAFTAAPTSIGKGRTLLWVRPLAALAARSLPETEDAAFPFWSPTSEALGFFAGGKLWVVRVSGGSPRLLCDAPEGRGGTWNRDEVIVFAPTRSGALFRVPATGGVPTPVTIVAAPDERGHVWPEFMPDGRHFLYLADGNANALDHHTLYVASLDEASRRRVMSVASNVVCCPAGQLVFARDRLLQAQPFDSDRLAVFGEAITLTDSVAQRSGRDHKADFSVSEEGVLVYRSMQSPATRLVWWDRARRHSPLIDTPAEHYEPVLSPDQTRVAIAIFDPRPSKRFGYGVIGVRSDIWILNRSTGARSQLTSDPAADWGPVWSPDGRRIVFSSNRRGRLELFEKNANETQEEQPLASSGMNPVAQSWSPDGQALVYSAFDPSTRGDLWILPMSGNRTPLPLLRGRFNEQQGQVSPDGKWIAYTSDESGRDEVYVRRFPNPIEQRRVSTDGGGDPRWRADGNELYYISADRRLMAVVIKSATRFEHGPPIPLFETGAPVHWYEARNLYDVSRDGRFLFMSPTEDDRAIPLTVVVNWATRLRP